MLTQFFYYTIISLFTFVGVGITKRRLHLGYAKFIGLVIVVVFGWLIGHLHFIGINIPWYIGSYVATSALAIYGIIFFIQNIKDKSFRKELLTVILLEIIGFIFFAFLNYLRTYRADIYGTERPMDYSFMYSFMKQKTMPPENPWLTGAVLNYYYIGQLTLSFMTKLTHIVPGLAYNFSIALWGILILQATYIFITSIKVLKIKAYWRFFIAMLVAIGGNFYHVVYYIVHHNMGFYFPSSTRVIPKTINEFPSYSVVLGDMHGHYLAFPFFIINLGILYFLFIKIRKLSKSNLRDITWLASIFAVISFWEFATNAWDVIPLLEIAGIIGLIFIVKHQKTLWTSIKKLFSALIIPFTVLLIPFTIFKFFFITPTNGIGFGFHADYRYYLSLFGQFMIIGICILFLLNLATIRNIRFEKFTFKQKLAIAFLSILLFVGIVNILTTSFVWIKDIFSIVNKDFQRANTLFKLYYQAWALLTIPLFSIILTLVSKYKNKFIKFTFYFITLIIGALMLLYFVKAITDNFGVPHKNYSKTGDNRLYTFLLDNKKAVKMLQGEKHVTLMNGEKDLLYYIKNHTANQPPVTILEGISYESYSLNGRIAINTGNRLVTGWPFHNMQWYNGYKFKYYYYNAELHKATHMAKHTDIHDRVNDVNAFYSGEKGRDVNWLKRKIHEYHIKYIIIGKQEIDIYKRTQVDKNIPYLQKVCPVVLQKNTHMILQCPEQF